jgi:hypothetical protein
VTKPTTISDLLPLWRRAGFNPMQALLLALLVVRGKAPWPPHDDDDIARALFAAIDWEVAHGGEPTWKSLRRWAESLA